MSTAQLSRGTRIDGSRYYRDYCAGCLEPIRVTDVGACNLCEDCGDWLEAKPSRSLSQAAEVAAEIRDHNRKDVFDAV